MSAEDNNWRSPQFRQTVVAQIDDVIQRSGMATAKKGIEMENHIFQKAKTREEYLGFVARLILHVRELNTKKGAQMGGTPGVSNMQDPINALQNLARQGTGNQMMGLAPPVAPQQNNPNMMQGMNPRPVLQQKLQPGVMMGGLGMNPQMSAPMGAGSPLSNQMANQAATMQTHMAQRKPDGSLLAQATPAGFVGPRVVGQGQYMRQSPPPPNASPAGAAPPPQMQAGNQMVPSPALVPSPSNPQLGPGMQTQMRSMGMASSPSSLNTPGQAVPTPSPCNLQEDSAYREKIRQLSKYIEPLRRMIARVGTEGVGTGNVEKLSKMKTLLDILTNPSKRMPLETLLKCEVVLEKVDLKRGDVVSGQTSREQHPLIEAIRNQLASPVINHTLQRTFGPSMEALFGSDIKNMPPPLKKKKTEEPPDDIPEVLQGEIARLDQRFKVSLDPTGGQQGAPGGIVHLVCWLDDKHLPCVPPVCLSVPEDYPATPPKCFLAQHEHSSTPFLLNVQSALSSRVAKLPQKFTVSQLLDTWEMSVRQACAPHTPPPVSSTTVIMGL